MTRAAVFAHFDKDNIIDNYVIYYLKALREVCEKVVFVSCNELPENEKNKLTGICDDIIIEVHNEYDFGSYKRGYLHLFNNDLLKDYDELVLVNDSCYGPFNGLKNVFDKMKLEDWDFWGITENLYGYRAKGSSLFSKRPHLQSYFMVFNENIFNSDCFKDFINSIKCESDKNEIVLKYEIGLSEILIKNNFKYEAYIKKYKTSGNPTIIKWRKLILNCDMPFLKCSLVRLANKKVTTIEDYPQVIEKISNYPIKLIKENAERTRVNEPNERSAPLWLKKSYYELMSYMPLIIRKINIILVKRLFPYLTD